MRRMIVGLAVIAACSKQEPSPQQTAASAAPSESPQRAGLLERGDDAPRIEATAHNGQAVKLADYRGKPVVVYFYPKDDTPGCTVEAQGFRDDYAELTKAGIVVIGVSTDDSASHKAFAQKYELPFLLLPDTDQKITKAFGVPMMNGRSKRVTFVIDKSGKIAKVFPEVTPAGHAQEVLSAVKSLEG